MTRAPTTADLIDKDDDNDGGNMGDNGEPPEYSWLDSICYGFVLYKDESSRSWRQRLKSRCSFNDVPALLNHDDDDSRDGIS